MKRMKRLRLMSLALLASCSPIYNTKFECPPGKGIGCAPVNEVLDLIVEREKGADIFVKDKDQALLLKAREKEKSRVISPEREGGTLTLIKNEEGEWIFVEEERVCP